MNFNFVSPSRWFSKVYLPAFLMIGLLPMQASVLLLNPGTSAARSTSIAANDPYAVSVGSYWNSGNAGSYGSGGLVYADGTAATGVSVVTDDLSNSGSTAVYNFSSPGGVNASNTLSTGLFATGAGKDGSYGSAASNVGYGGIAMQVTGLAYGTYDIYVTAAYAGTKTLSSLPGGATAAQQNVWAFSGASVSTLTAGTYDTADSLLENSNSTAWTLDNNFAKITVTISADNPVLMIISEGAANDAMRGWLNSVEIVSVPEPTSVLLVGGVVLLYILQLRRRRKALAYQPVRNQRAGARWRITSG